MPKHLLGTASKSGRPGLELWMGGGKCFPQPRACVLWPGHDNGHSSLPRGPKLGWRSGLGSKGSDQGTEA